MIPGLNIAQGKTGKNLTELLKNPKIFDTKTRYDGIVIWAGGNDASETGKMKNTYGTEYMNPKKLFEQISWFFQSCAKTWPSATQCFIGIPPRQDVVRKYMCDFHDLMNGWVERGARRGVERMYQDLFFCDYDEERVVDMRNKVHVRNGCLKCKKALVDAVKKSAF